MYSKRSPPTGPAGMELPYISMLAIWGIAPSTGISLLRRFRSDVVSLLKVDVLKEIAAHRPGRNGVAVHIDAGNLGDRTLNRHQSLAEVLVNTEFYLGCHHKNDSVRASLCTSCTRQWHN